jgi:ribosome-binding factor A
MTSHRSERVGDALRGVIAELLAREIKDPRIGMVTLTRVQMSADLKHARVFFSCLGDDLAHERSLAGLRSASGYIKAHAARRLKLRFTPEITFVFDPSIETSVRVAALLRDQRASETKRVHSDEPDHDPPPEGDPADEENP